MAIIADLGSIRTSIELPIKGWNKNFGKITDDVKKYPKTTDKALGRAGKAWEKHAKTIKAASLGMVAFGAAAVTGLGFAVKAAGDFQQSMTNTQAVAGATSEELQRLTGFAREMGKQTVFSAKESADAMLSLASAGQDTEEIMNSLKGTLNLAAATNSDLAFTSRTVASTLSQFGLAASESDRIANVFTATISASQANMDKLATSMSVVGPVAKAVGLSLEETTSILGSLFNAGLDASTAGTSLRQAIAQLLKPTDDAKDALKRLNVETVDSGGQLWGITDIIRDLEKSGLSAADALTIFGVRAGPGMLALVSQGADAIEALTAKVTDTNKAAEIAALQVDTFQGQVKLLKSAFSELQITIGNELLPILTEYTTKLSGIINFTSDWAADNPILTSTLVKLGGAVGVVSLGLGALGFGALGAAKVAGVLKLMAVDVSILAGALGGVTGIAVIAGVGFSLAFGLASVTIALKELISPSKDAGTALDQLTKKVWDSTASLEANLTALKNVTVEVEDLKKTLPGVFTGTMREGVKEYATQAAIASLAIGTVADKLLLIERSKVIGTIEGQVAAFRLTLESMGLQAAAIDDLAKKEKQRLEEAVIGSKAHTEALKKLDTQVKASGATLLESRRSLSELARTGDAGAIAMIKLLSSKVEDVGNAAILSRSKLAELMKAVESGALAGTATIQREADKQVAVLKQRTKLETDWIKVNGIIQLGLVEKNVEDILTLHGKETKEKKDARIKAEKEARQARNKDLQEEVKAPEVAAKKLTLKLVGIGKDRDAALLDLENKMLTKRTKIVDTTNRLMLDSSKEQIRAGEAVGAAMVEAQLKTAKATKEAQLKAVQATKAATAEIEQIWNNTASNIQRATSDLFASMIDPSIKASWGQLWDSLERIAIDALADILASQAAAGLARLLTGDGGAGGTAGAFSKIFGTGAKAAEVFGPPAPTTVNPTTTTAIGAVSSSATLGAITSAALPIAITAGVFLAKRQREAQRELENELRLTKRAVDIQVPIGTLRRLEDVEGKVAFLARVQGLTEGEVRSILGVATTGERIAAARVFIANQPQLRQARLRRQAAENAGPLPEPIAFIPRRPVGTDRFGRPLAGTVAMAPARTGGNVTFGDIIIQLPEGSEIQNMDSADWERIMRDNIQPAAEAIGLRFSRADNVLAS